MQVEMKGGSHDDNLPSTPPQNRQQNIPEKAHTRHSPPLLAITPPSHRPVGTIVLSGSPREEHPMMLNNDIPAENRHPDRESSGGDSPSIAVNSDEVDSAQLRRILADVMTENEALKQALAVADPSMAAKFGIQVNVWDPLLQARNTPMLMPSDSVETAIPSMLDDLKMTNAQSEEDTLSDTEIPMHTPYVPVLTAQVEPIAIVQASATSISIMPTSAQIFAPVPVQR